MSDFSAKYDPGVHVSADSTLCLHRNENLFVGTDWTVDTARELVTHSPISSYPDATSQPLREALAELYGVQPGNVFVGNGSDEVLADLLSLLRSSYDAVHCSDVCFKVYPMLAERLGYEQVVLPGNTFETGRIDSAGFRGLAVVDSPNGISGTSMQPDDLGGLFADDRSFFIWDNVYGEYAGQEMPSETKPNVATVRSFSKFYGLASLRVGYCVADEAVVSELLVRKDAFNVNGFGQVMALEALRRRDEFVALRDLLVAERAELVRELTDLGFHVLPSDSVAVLASHQVHDAAFLQEELLKRNIAVRRFADPATANFIRITVAPRPQRERFLHALGEITTTGAPGRS